MDRNDGFIAGDRVTVRHHSHGMQGRIMAVAEGYAMVRYKNASPFIAAVKDLTRVIPDYLS